MEQTTESTSFRQSNRLRLQMVEIAYAAILVALLEALFRVCQEVMRLDWEMVWWSALGRGSGYLMHAAPRLDAVVLAAVLLLVWLTYSVLILDTQALRSEAYEYMLMDLTVAVGIYFTGSALRNMQEMTIVEADMAWLGLGCVFGLVYVRGIRGFQEIRRLVGEGTLARRLKLQNRAGQLIRLTHYAAACCAVAALGGRYDRSTLQPLRNVDILVWAAVVYCGMIVAAMFMFSPMLRAESPDWKWLRRQERHRLGIGLLTAMIAVMTVQLVLLASPTSVLRFQNSMAWSSVVFVFTILLARTVVRFDAFVSWFFRKSYAAHQKLMMVSIRDLAMRLFGEQVGVRLFERAAHTPHLAVEVSGGSLEENEDDIRSIARAILTGVEVPPLSRNVTHGHVTLKGVDGALRGVIIVTSPGIGSAFLGNQEVQAVLEGIAAELDEKAVEFDGKDRVRFVSVRVAR